MKKIYYLILFLVGLVSCHDDDTPVFSNHTVIVYMVADNSLDEYAYRNINKMEFGLPDNALNLIVYFDPKNAPPQLLRIQRDKKQVTKIQSEVIKEYKEQNSADPYVMQKVLMEIKSRYPSNSYGLIVWSHADAWLPPKRINTRSILEDNGVEMDIRDFAKAIPNDFDYIIFDACWLSSIEFLYELKDKTPYVLASSIEVLADGMPYTKIISLLFENSNTEAKMKAVANEYFRFYEAKKEAYQTAEIALTKMSELGDLAKQTKRILLQNPLIIEEYKVAQVQKLYTEGNKRPLYDFMDFFAKNYSPSELTGLQKQLAKTVIYEAHTNYYLNEVPLENSCGLSCYIPLKNSNFNDYYRTLKWTKESGFYTLFE